MTRGESPTGSPWTSNVSWWFITKAKSPTPNDPEEVKAGYHPKGEELPKKQTAAVKIVIF